MADFEPGAVYMVTSVNPAMTYAAIREHKGWSSLDPGIGFAGDIDVTGVRPLVLLDPEDRAQAERLSEALIAAMCKSDPEWDRLRSFEVRSHMRAALREYAEPPKSPKPDEPQGLGAVIKDGVDGARWVRFHSKTGWWWRNNQGVTLRYDDLSVAEVLSEGVTP